MKHLFKSIILGSILIGSFALAINMLFGGNTIAFLSQQKINGVYIWKFDAWGYIENIRLSLANPSELTLTFTDRTWNDDIINNLAYMLDIVIFALNIFLYPTRVSMYVGKVLLVISGINLTNSGGLDWLVNTINFLTQLQIPYV